jgi:hypothetical protein
MRYLLFLLLSFSLFSCKTDTSTPEEVSKGLKSYSAILGDFAFDFKRVQETNSAGKTQNLIAVTIFKNDILVAAEQEMLNAFSSGLAFYIYKNLTEKQLKKFDGIQIKLSVEAIETVQNYKMTDLALIKKFATQSESYIGFVKNFDIKSMYSAYGDFVKKELTYDAFEQMMLSGFEDDFLEDVLLVGAGFFEEERGNVLHLRYVVIYETAPNRRHSVYYLIDDGDTLIDGFQL